MVLVHSTTTRDFIVHNHMTWFKGHDCTLPDALGIQCVSADSACGDGLEWTQHCLFAVLLTVLPLCLCLSDPTLTVENVMEVMGEMGDWGRVAGMFGLEIPYSKLQEIKQQSYTERDRSRLAGEYWVNTDPNASWRTLADVLYKEGEDSARRMVKQYLPKGMCTS